MVDNIFLKLKENIRVWLILEYYKIIFLIFNLDNEYKGFSRVFIS